jgi:phage-related protein
MANGFEDIGSAAGKFASGVFDDVKGKIGTVLNANKKIGGEVTDDAINAARQTLVNQTRGISGVYTRMNNGEKDLGNAIKAAYSKTGEVGGGTSWGTVAGSYIGASAAYRVASGGGLYRDKNGNNNIIGVPFV